MGFPGGTVVKNPPAKAGDSEDAGLIPGLGSNLDADLIPGSIGKIPYRKKLQPIPVFLPRKFHGQKRG